MGRDKWKFSAKQGVNGKGHRQRFAITTVDAATSLLKEVCSNLTASACDAVLHVVTDLFVGWLTMLPWHHALLEIHGTRLLLKTLEAIEAYLSAPDIVIAVVCGRNEEESSICR
jgi:hypothetical protein